LRVVDQRVATKVKQCVVKVRKGFLEVAEQEVRDSLLKIGYGEVLIELDSALVALDLIQKSVRTSRKAAQESAGT